MPTDKQEQAQEEQDQARNTRFRESLANAYAALQAEKTIQSFSAFTLEEALDAQIDRIEGKGTKLRPNELDRVDRILNQVIQAVDQLKSLPPESFSKPDQSSDVNTPEQVNG